jgi:hypothetical protein
MFTVVLIVVAVLAAVIVADPLSPPSCDSLTVEVVYPHGLRGAAVDGKRILLNFPHLDVDTIRPGESLVINHEGLWVATTKLLRIRGQEAYFKYSFFDTDHAKSITCKFTLSLTADPKAIASAEGFNTKAPEALRPFLFNPEELSGIWIVSSYEEITAGLPRGGSRVHESSPYEDIILATIAADSSERYRLLQEVRVYPNEEDAVANFEGEYGSAIYMHTIPPVEIPEDLTFQPLSENHILGCTYLGADGLWCYLNEQYGRYIVEVFVPIDEEAVTFQDWEQVNRLVESKLIRIADVNP